MSGAPSSLTKPIQNPEKILKNSGCCYMRLSLIADRCYHSMVMKIEVVKRDESCCSISKGTPQMPQTLALDAVFCGNSYTVTRLSAHDLQLSAVEIMEDHHHMTYS
ncbi:unnamed protein product [Vicia faba]|uniref:Uncharacterized protein n=1 Tax=Vicia faba TaxID=3906 RepID=A0AAV0YQM3_VICFA|nr:unnamed protein product [Vicia faba]